MASATRPGRVRTRKNLAAAPALAPFPALALQGALALRRGCFRRPSGSVRIRPLAIRRRPTGAACGHRTPKHRWTSPLPAPGRRYRGLHSRSFQRRADDASECRRRIFPVSWRRLAAAAPITKRKENCLARRLNRRVDKAFLNHADGRGFRSAAADRTTNAGNGDADDRRRMNWRRYFWPAIGLSAVAFRSGCWSRVARHIVRRRVGGARGHTGAQVAAGGRRARSAPMPRWPATTTSRFCTCAGGFRGCS